MGRRKLIDNERKFTRSFTVSPQVWDNWKLYCGRKSMSEMLEVAMLRVMDENGDILSLKEQCVELKTNIDAKKHKMGKDRIDMETMQSQLQHMESRIDEIKMSDEMQNLSEAREGERLEEIKKDYLPVFDKYPMIKNRLIQGRSSTSLQDLTDFEKEHLVDELSYKTAFSKMPRRRVREIIEVCWNDIQQKGV